MDLWCAVCFSCRWFSCGLFFFFFKQKTAYEMRISDWSSDVCSSDLVASAMAAHANGLGICRQYVFSTIARRNGGACARRSGFGYSRLLALCLAHIEPF